MLVPMPNEKQPTTYTFILRNILSSPGKHNFFCFLGLMLMLPHNKGSIRKTESDILFYTLLPVLVYPCCYSM